MKSRLVVVSSGLCLLLACQFGPPSKDIQDTAVQDTGPWEAPECEPEAVDGFALAQGNYALSIDEALLNDCENSVGKGLHIHVGEDQTVFFSQDESCLEAMSDPGADLEMPWGGTTDGQTFTLEGFVALDIGTCQIGINATMTGTMTADSTFSYEIQATADVNQEFSPDACQLIIGETEDHTFGKLPCDQAWVGVGSL